MSPLLSRRALAGLALVPVVGCAVPPARAQRGALLPDFADLAERVLPAVVNIAVTSEQRGEIPSELRGTPRALFPRPLPWPRPAGAGGGVGLHHRSLRPGRHQQPRHRQRDPRVWWLACRTARNTRRGWSGGLSDDLALLRVEARGALPSVPWGSSGSCASAIGCSVCGQSLAGSGAPSTSGIVSARVREIGAGPFDDFIQTDAPINPGNSGWPAVQTWRGRDRHQHGDLSPSGASIRASAFAVPSDLARA